MDSNSIVSGRLTTRVLHVLKMRNVATWPFDDIPTAS